MKSKNWKVVRDVDVFIRDSGLTLAKIVSSCNSTCQPGNTLLQVKIKEFAGFFLFCRTLWLQTYMPPSKELKYCLVFSLFQLTTKLVPSFYDSIKHIV